MVHESDLGSSRTNAGSLTFPFAVNLSLKSAQCMLSYFLVHKHKPGASDIKWRPQRDQEGPLSTVMKLKPIAGSESRPHQLRTNLAGNGSGLCVALELLCFLFLPPTLPGDHKDALYMYFSTSPVNFSPSLETPLYSKTDCHTDPTAGSGRPPQSLRCCSSSTRSPLALLWPE